MRKTFLLVLVFTLATSHASAQTGVTNDKDDLPGRIAAWNTAFAKKDIPALTDLFSENFQFTSAGGLCKGRDECAKGFELLLKARPDLTNVNKPSKVEMNPAGSIAYETGDWAEAWTQPDGRVELRGKYFAMWRRNKDKRVWYLLAAIYTPLQCVGESKYCK